MSDYIAFGSLALSLVAVILGAIRHHNRDVERFARIEQFLKDKMGFNGK